MGYLVKWKMKKLFNWSKAAVALRKRQVPKLSQEAWARRLSVSTSEVRRWEQGVRIPTCAEALKLGSIAGNPECFDWWELAGLSRQEIEDALLLAPPETKRRRYSEEVILKAHAALDAVLDHARSDIAEKIIADLDKFAG